MSDFIKVGAVRRYTEFSRLQVAIETASKEALTQLLHEIHAKAVENAPIRTDLNYPHTKIPLPPQVAAPGLLKNSICYSVDGGDLQELNSYGGEYTVSEGDYPSVGTFGALKEKGTVQGFVGTFVIHEDYANWSNTYESTPKYIQNAYGEKVLNNKKERVTRKISKSTARFAYGAWVEFNSKPFLRPAVYDILDSREGVNIMAKIFKRDMAVAASSGVKSEQIQRIL